MTLRIKNHKKLSIPAMSRELFRWTNELSTKVHDFTFTLGDEAHLYSLSMSSEAQDLDDYQYGLLVEIDKVPASIWLSEWPFNTQMQKFLVGKKLSQLPADLRSELIETVMRPLLSAFSFHTNTQVRIISFLKLRPSSISPSSLWLNFYDKTTYEESKIVVLMHEKLHPVMSKVLAFWPNRQSNNYWLNQFTEVWIEVGKLELSLDELTQLESSDILLIDPSAERGKARLRLASGDSFQVRFEGQQLILESGATFMSELQNNDAITNIADMPIRLTFDLGDLVLPFKDVQSLAQGSVVNLNNPVGQSVTIRSLNRVIGIGELIDIEGQLGVKVVKLLEPVTSENING